MIPLTMTSPYQEVRLVEIHGGQSVKHRLEALGLVPGTTFSVISMSEGCPVILALKCSRLAIGRGLAHIIMVTALAAEEGEN